MVSLNTGMLHEIECCILKSMVLGQNFQDLILQKNKGKGQKGDFRVSLALQKTVFVHFLLQMLPGNYKYQERGT